MIYYHRYKFLVIYYIMTLARNIILAIVIIIVVIFLYNYFRSNKKDLTGLKPGKHSSKISSSKLPHNKGSSNYAYSMWFYVSDWQYRLTEPKELLVRTSNTGKNINNPKITLAPYENNIHINISTYPLSSSSSDESNKKCGLNPVWKTNPNASVWASDCEKLSDVESCRKAGKKYGTCMIGGLESSELVKTSDSDQSNLTHIHSDHECVIRNFPLQKWVNLIISLNGRTLDVYLDGKLVRTCILEGVAKPLPDSNIRITPNGGFSGWTSNLQYWSNPLNPQEAYNVYKNGYGGSTLGSIASFFEKYKIKVAYLVNNTEEGSFSI